MFVSISIVSYLSVKDQSVTGAVTRFPLSHSPARRSLAAFGSLGSRPVKRRTTSATNRTMTMAPTIFNSIFKAFLPAAR